MNSNERAQMLRSTLLLDYDRPSRQALMQGRGWRLLPESERIRAACTYVGDNIGYRYNLAGDLPAFRVLADGIGPCDTQGVLLMAWLRACAMPCRFQGFTIRGLRQPRWVPRRAWNEPERHAALAFPECCTPWDEAQRRQYSQRRMCGLKPMRAANPVRTQNVFGFSP